MAGRIADNNFSFYHDSFKREKEAASKALQAMKELEAKNRERMVIMENPINGGIIETTAPELWEGYIKEARVLKKL